MSQQFRIWSNEHSSWWRPATWGYTGEIAEAGWFTPEETLHYLYGSACGSPPGRPGAVAVDGFGLRFVLELQREVEPDSPEQTAAAQTAEPERHCHRCSGPNLPWSAPSPLWNEVMRGGDINGDERYGGIVCPTCFVTLAEQEGTAERWRLSAEVVHRTLQTVTPSGRVWDDQAWLWVDPGDVHRPTTLLPIGSPYFAVCLVCDEPWPCPGSQR